MRDAFLRVGTTTVASLVFLLLVAGALVTSTESGLAVPDWPLSYGKVMPPMVGGIFYEHGHRLVAAAVSTLVGLQFGLIFFFLEGNRRLKILAGAAFAAILLQAVLGGLTVLLLLPPVVSSAHAALAEIVFGLTTVVALMCSRTWTTLTKTELPSPLPFSENPSPSSSSLPLSLEENLRIPSKSEETDIAFRWVGLATAAIYIQIVLGAVMRHTGAGLAIPDFPTFFDSWLPSLSILSRPGVPIHLAHRLGAVVVVLLVLRAAKSLSNLPVPLLAALGPAWAGLVCLQAFLGASSIWSSKAVPMTVAHLATGALCWVTGVLALACLGACRNPSNALSSPRRA
ncbi:MAG: COX15/CtaA family protein [Thermoanaerobaculia bacterium]|nr:COX15/CtaA family protein [Thermoanaerobaculia bacterium]